MRDHQHPIAGCAGPAGALAAAHHPRRPHPPPIPPLLSPLQVLHQVLALVLLRPGRPADVVVIVAARQVARVAVVAVAVAGGRQGELVVLGPALGRRWRGWDGVRVVAGPGLGLEGGRTMVAGGREEWSGAAARVLLASLSAVRPGATRRPQTTAAVHHPHAAPATAPPAGRAMRTASPLPSP